MKMMNRINAISLCVVEYYAKNKPTGSQIMHTQSVAHFTKLIAAGEEMPANVCELQEIAAWLHDIGCPPARERYGDSLPPHQESEGKRLVHEWLDNSSEFTPKEVKWLADVVGGHHHLTEAVRLEFKPLYEADLIVNLFEEYYKPEMAQRFIDSGAVSTRTGKRLFQQLFGVEAEG
jgi:hypothetical protein